MNSVADLVFFDYHKSSLIPNVNRNPIDSAIIGVPLLYSPLYRSIRIVLFGALSLSPLMVNAAITSNDEQVSAPASSASNDLLYDNDEYISNDEGANDSQLSEPVSVTEIKPVAESKIDTSTLTADNEDLSQLINSNDKRADKGDRTKSLASTSQNNLDLDDDSIQSSLVRLAEFYQLKPDSSSTLQPNAAIAGDEQNLAADESVSNAQSIPKLGVNLNLVPITVDNAPRCEGVWVYPQSNPNYQRAINNNANNTGADLQTSPNSQAALFSESDYGYYDNANYAELSGNVIIDQGTQHIEAQKVVLDLATGVAAAQGQVMFTDQAIGNANNNANVNANLRLQNDSRNRLHNDRAGLIDSDSQAGLIGVADNLAYNTGTGQSTAYDVAFASVPLQAHGYAKKLNRPNDNQYELDDVMFSTCPPTDRKWQLDAKSIDLDTQTGRGKAYNTTFKIADVPVLYLPYFNFPIDSRRSSGFLLPSASVSSDSGLELDVPYYFNLAPNYDATLNTHLYTNRNPMLSGEFRYLTENFGQGILNGSYLPNDKEFNDEDRSSLFYEHYWSSQSIPRLSGDANYSYVSDADYLNDFDTLGLSNNTLNLPRRARLNYYNDYVNGELKVETYQTLDAFNNNGEALQDKDKPYSRLPQLSLNYRLPWSDTINVTGVHDSAYFKKSIDDGSEAEKSGVRVYNKLSAAYPIEAAWGYVNPKLSLQHLYTSYDEDSLQDNDLSAEDGDQSVFVPQASIDAGLHLYQAGSPFGAFDNTMGGYQLLSPRLKYTYSPFKDQNDIPNFNTRIASINYEQLFSDSWFLGYDRLQDLHAITPGVNYRYIDATGVTRFDGSIAEQFYYGSGRVTLEGKTPVFNKSSSGIVWNASTQPYNNVWVDVSGALDNSYDLNYITTELRYQPTQNSLFNVGFVKRQEDNNTNQLPISAFTASAIFPINNTWRVLAQGQYDYRSNRTLDALVGIDYEDCCIGFAVYGRRYYNDLNLNDEPNQTIMAELRLNGLGGGKGRLTRLLADKVLGFEPVQSAWKD